MKAKKDKYYRAVIAYAKTVGYSLAKDHLGNVDRDLYGEPYFTDGEHDITYCSVRQSWKKFLRKETQKKQEWEKLRKQKPKKIGDCMHCQKPVFHNRKYVLLDYEVAGITTNMTKDKYFLNGVVHKKCEVAALRHFIESLKQEVSALHWLVGYKNELKKKEEPILDEQKKELEGKK